MTVIHDANTSTPPKPTIAPGTNVYWKGKISYLGSM